MYVCMYVPQYGVFTETYAEAFIALVRIILLPNNLKRGHRISMFPMTTAGRHARTLLITFFTLQMVRPHREVLRSLEYKVAESAA